MRLAGLALMACLLVAGAGACGGGGGGGQTPRQIAQNVYQAINQPGKVYHVRGDDGIEVWIDIPNQRYRRREPASQGSLTSVGEGWTRISYDPFGNKVKTEDTKPAGLAVARIDDPVAGWLEALSALAYGRELRTIGETVADGKQVLALEARSPIFEEDKPTGGFLVGRVELDLVSYLPLAFERRQEVPAGQPTDTPSAAGDSGPKRVRYTVSELIARDALPEDFFARKVVEDEVVTLEQNLQKVRDLGLTAYWLGKAFQGAVNLRFSDEAVAVIPDPEKGEASIHYALELGSAGGVNNLSDEAVVIKLAKADKAAFGPPAVQEFAGDLPERSQQVTARGQTGTLFISILTPGDLPCPTGSVCPKTKTPLYTRLDVTLGSTAVQIETFARIDKDGNDRNPYNSIEGIIGLAEALTAAT